MPDAAYRSTWLAACLLIPVGCVCVLYGEAVSAAIEYIRFVRVVVVASCGTTLKRENKLTAAAIRHSERCHNIAQ